MVNERAVENITALIARPEIGGNEKFLIAVNVLKGLGIGFEFFGKLDPRNAHSFTHEISRLKESMDSASRGGMVLVDEWTEHAQPNLSEDSWNYAFQGIRDYVPQQTTPPEEVLHTFQILSAGSPPAEWSRPAWLSEDADDTVGRG